MKKVTFLLVLFFVFKTGIAQLNSADTVHQFTKQDYLQKSKHQKNAAWGLLGGGFVLGTIGTAISVKEAGKGTRDIFFFFLHPDQKPLGFNERRFNTGLTLMFIGGAASVLSIPLFISSAKKKKKASFLSFSKQLIPQIKGPIITGYAVQSITLKIRI